MKGYKFKLEALLKIRKLKEEQCKMSIGKLQVQITQLKNEISVHQAGIETAYTNQESELKSGLNGLEARFHPYFVSGKRAHIKQLNDEINYLTKEVNQKFEELKHLRADVKVIDEMKDKDMLVYKKKVEKKMNEEIEEQNQNWRQVVMGK